MSVKVAGCWELGWSTPIMEYDLWKFPLLEYNIDEFIMTPISGINKKMTEYNDISEVIENNPDLTPVFVDEKGEESLEEFDHPENALYILGKASYSPMMGREGKSVKIHTPNSAGRLWPHQAIVLVLNDRINKECH